MEFDVIVIGGGPAGMMASITAVERGKKVALIEKNDTPGKKLLMTGGGRCNITNLCEVEEFIENVPRNHEFLYSALYSFPPSSVVEFFESSGVKTKVEENERVFPESDRSNDVLDALVDRINEAGVSIIQGTVSGITVIEGAVTGIRLVDGRSLRSSSVIIATGGITYPGTGSSGEGHSLAREIGVNIVATSSRLRPFIVMGKDLENLQGVSIPDVIISCNNETAQGPVLITGSGISGPGVFDMDLKVGSKFPSSLELDLVPAMSDDELEKEILSQTSSNPKKLLRNIISIFVPKRLSAVLIRKSGTDPEFNCNQLSKQKRKDLIRQLKHFSLMVSKGEDRAGMITSGGVDVGDVDPATMGSRSVNGLYFAGEVLDVHGRTGGFNLQIAFATGRLSGDNC